MAEKKNGTDLSARYKKGLRSFLKDLNRAGHKPNEKRIHALRVDIKKMRAFFQFMEVLRPRQWDAKAHYKGSLKKVFRKAAAVRELQMHGRGISAYNLPALTVEKYAAFLKHKEVKREHAFRKAVKAFRIHKDEISAIVEMCKKTNEESLKEAHDEFIRKSIFQIRDLMVSGNNSQVIHQIRKLLKSLNAIGALFDDDTTDHNISRWFSLTKKVGESIGEWHDKVMLGDSLEEFLESDVELEASEEIKLEKLIQKIRKDSGRFFPKLILALAPVVEHIPMKKN